MTAIDFLKRAADGKHRIVSSGDLDVFQISEARANDLFFVDDSSGLGWALLPWDLTTAKDQSRFVASERMQKLARLERAATALFVDKDDQPSDGFIEAIIAGDIASATELNRPSFEKFNAAWDEAVAATRDLLPKAGALVAAEIDRLQRAAK